MKLSGTLLLMLASLMLVNVALAGPPQRLIIQFDTPLNQDKQQKLNKEIKQIIKTDYVLLPHSTDQRWIITVDHVLDKAELNRAVEAISGLDNVIYAEPDRLLDIDR